MGDLSRVFLLISALAMFSCGGSIEPVAQDKAEDPLPATLIFPENNSECKEGTVINDQQSTITFQWEASTNTDSYTVHITNLETTSETIKDVHTNEAEITLDRSTPYKWYVTSESNSSEVVAQSATWKFYNAGNGEVSHAPFPAEAVNPEMGESIDLETGTVNLTWEGNDIDGDIVEFEIFYGSNNPPTTSLGVLTESNLGAEISAGQTYYWYVRTFDSQGNISESDTFEFKVN
ncbi:hypothetical protein [Flagellimonas myxillae]|uniref:hypothetical protein n=1 Tax=Flagellimonas myxillae TaxID=2942214 RepID=UPI00201E8709|nr:hypothetical protein [Muricauda myxillae]MCL6266325.1 hypothetical protein [Muricauda myxillae]